MKVDGYSLGMDMDDIYIHVEYSIRTFMWDIYLERPSVASVPDKRQGHPSGISTLGIHLG